MQTMEFDPDQNPATWLEETPLSAAASPETVMQHFAQSFAGTEVTGRLRLFCHGAMPERVMCILELPSRWRSRPDGPGEILARSTVSRAYQVVAAFACPGRSDAGQLKGHACDACRARLHKGALHVDPAPAAGQLRPMPVNFAFHAPGLSRTRLLMRNNRRLERTYP